MKNLFTLFISFILFSCNNQEQKSKENAKSVTLFATRTNSAAFNGSFKSVLGSYYQLKDNFIAENDLLIDSAAKKLMKSIDSLKLDELKDDSTLNYTAKTYTEGVKAELIGLLGEKLIDDKKKSFQMISEQLYDLIKVIQFDGEVIYHHYCPMAFNNDGATWLSNSTLILNPYLSSTMLNCGELRDTIDFKQKNTTN
jgi:Cu(I)/Ag(I) efflux system membrane fusion protein